MSPLDWKPLPPTSDVPEEWDFERESTAAWLFKGVLKGLWWAFLGFAALVVLFTSPVGFMVAVVLGWILWRVCYDKGED